MRIAPIAVAASALLVAASDFRIPYPGKEIPCRNAPPQRRCPLGSLESDAPIATPSAPAGPGPREAEAMAADLPDGVDRLEPLPGRPGDPGVDPDLADRRGGSPPGGATGESGLRDLVGIAVERLGSPLQWAGRRLHPEDGDWTAPGHGTAGHGGRAGRAVHGERGLALGRTLPAEARRVSLRDG